MHTSCFLLIKNDIHIHIIVLTLFEHVDKIYRMLTWRFVDLLLRHWLLCKITLSCLLILFKSIIFNQVNYNSVMLYEGCLFYWYFISVVNCNYKAFIISKSIIQILLSNFTNILKQIIRMQKSRSNLHWQDISI